MASTLKIIRIEKLKQASSNARSCQRVTQINLELNQFNLKQLLRVSVLLPLVGIYRGQSSIELSKIEPGVKRNRTFARRILAACSRSLAIRFAPLIFGLIANADLSGVFVNDNPDIDVALVW